MIDWVLVDVAVSLIAGGLALFYLLNSPARARRFHAASFREGHRGSPLTHVAVFKMRNFEVMRASLGLEEANRLMREQGERLRSALPGCVVGRVGRTTVEVAFSAASAADIHALIASAVAALQAPHTVGGIDIALSVTCGAATLLRGRVDEGVIDRAAGALAGAQARGQAIGIDAGEERTAASIGDLELARFLSAALRVDGIDLYYQPKFDCRDDTIRAAEALLRWNHPELGSFATDRVITAAERLGMMPALTDWVLERALLDRQALMVAGHDVTLFVNLSGLVLADKAYVDRLIERVGTVGGIGFEITETAVIAEPEDAIFNVTRMSEAGIPIAIDDYGSGLSSLAYLKQLPAHELKIDRMFVKELTESHRDPLLVRSSIDLAHALDMKVTAEGVEDAMTLSLLRIMGCDTIQGYLIAPALPLAELLAFLGDSASLGGLGRAPLALPGAGEGAVLNVR